MVASIVTCLQHSTPLADAQPSNGPTATHSVARCPGRIAWLGTRRCHLAVGRHESSGENEPQSGFASRLERPRQETIHVIVSTTGHDAGIVLTIAGVAQFAALIGATERRATRPIGAAS